MVRFIVEPKRVFLIVWFGQLVSSMGTGLSAFALGVFVFQRTGSTTQFALVSVFTMVPAIVLSPFAGALADRWDRRRMMLIANAASGLVVLVLAVLLHSDRLDLWHIYAAVAVIALATALRDPAYNASVSQMVPKEQLGRASGLVQSGENIGLIAPPVVAGILILAIGLTGVLVIDALTYLVGLVAIMVVRFPRLARSAEDAAGSSLWRDIVAGWRYMMEYRGLLLLCLIGAATSFSVGLTQIVITPLVLGFSSAAFLGAIFSIGGLAIFLGGVVMAAWGGPKRRALGVFVFALAQSVSLFVVSLRPNVVLISIGIFGLLFSIQIVRGCTATIVRAHVPHEMQARVFSLSRFVAWSTLPVSYLLAGPLVDVFNPMLEPAGSLTGSVGGLIGVGTGRGIAFLIMAVSLVYAIVVVTICVSPRMRNVEAELREAESQDVDIPGIDSQKAELRG